MWADPETHIKPPTVLMFPLSPNNMGVTISCKTLDGKSKVEIQD